MDRVQRPFQLHLSTCVILMFLAGGLMYMYMQFTSLLYVPNVPDFLSDYSLTKHAMQATWLILSLSTLGWAAYLCEKLTAQQVPVPVPVRIRSDRRR
jgi:hypothetical protein